MRISLKKLLVTAAFGFVVGCAPGTAGTGDGGAECTSNLDCEGTMQCFLALGICEEPCTSDDECSGDRPVCNMRPDADSDYPLDADGTRDHCICTADSCAAGETCSDVTGACEAGDEGDAGPQDECTVATEVADCGADAFCVDGVCEDACVDDDCFAEGGLCLYDDTDVEFNQCVPADEVVGTCAAADNADAVSGADDIVIYDVERIAETPNACGTNGNLAISAYLLSAYSEEDISAADAQDILNRPGFDAGGGKFFQDADNVTELEALGADFPDEYLFTFHICGDPGAEVAAQIDTGTNVSNAFCFDPQMTIQ